MSDSAFKSRPFPGFTTAQLSAAIASGRGTEAMVAEVARRARVALGDSSVMFDAERLRAVGERFHVQAILGDRFVDLYVHALSADAAIAQAKSLVKGTDFDHRFTRFVA